MPVYAFPQAVSTVSLPADQPDLCQIRRESKAARTASYFDTFDWRLHRHGLQLVRTREAVSLESAATGEALQSIRPGFGLARKCWWDLPAGPLRDACQPILGPRALLEVVRLQTHRELFAVTDELDKVVLRFSNFFLERIDQRRPDRPVRLLEPHPLKGYEQHLAAFLELLRGQGFEQFEQGLLAFGLHQVGVVPNQYSSKVRIQLDSQMPALEAVVRVLRRLLDTMRQNVDGILQDIDTEFLHDFRVALRRSRSVLGQLNHLFAPDEIQPHRDGLAEIQRQTNRLRDLDVLLLGRGDLEQSLPAGLRPGLGAFFTDLARSRRASLEGVHAYLRDQRFHQVLSVWSDYLTRDPVSATEAARAPIQGVARAVIRRRYAKIGRFHKKIRSAPTPAALHALRIECKKLRYLLEVFQSLFPTAPRAGLVKQLKSLQDILGGYNDTHQQQRELSDYLARCALGGKRALAVGASVGGLVVVLSADQARLMARLEPALRRFKGAAGRQVFEALFPAAGEVAG